MVTLIVAALAVGAAAGLKDTAASAVKDAYSALKGLVSSKYSKVSVAGLEGMPESEAQRTALKESLTAAGAGNDEELTGLAKRLLAVVEEKDPEVFPAVGIIVTKSKAGAIIINGVDVESEGSGIVVNEAETTGNIEIRNATVRAGGGKDSTDPK